MYFKIHFVFPAYIKRFILWKNYVKLQSIQISANIKGILVSSIAPVWLLPESKSGLISL